MHSRTCLTPSDILKEKDRLTTQQFRYLPLIYHLGLGKVIFPISARDRNEFIEFSKTQALQRTKQGQDGDRKDFSHYLLHGKDPETGTGFSISELWAKVIY